MRNDNALLIIPEALMPAKESYAQENLARLCITFSSLELGLTHLAHFSLASLNFSLYNPTLFCTLRMEMGMEMVSVPISNLHGGLFMSFCNVKFYLVDHLIHCKVTFNQIIYRSKRPTFFYVRILPKIGKDYHGDFS